MEEESKRFLVVDDLKHNRFLLSKILLQFGEVEEATNGVEAVEAFRRSLTTNNPYHLIFLDILMPEMDGHQTLQSIRAIETEKNIFPKEQVKVVIVSALGDWDNVLSSFKEGGVVEYLVKPVTTSQVRLIVNKSLQQK